MAKVKRKKNDAGTIVPMIIMIVGALSLVIYGILIAILGDKNGLGKLYGMKLNWPQLILVSITYILIPLSVKLGAWTLAWGIVINIIAVISLIGVFINADYKSLWTYIGAIPYVLLILGSGLWAATAYKNKQK